MDIAKIRKKLKKSKTPDKQKTEAVPQEETQIQPLEGESYQDSKEKETPKIVDKKAETAQEDTKKLGLDSRTELSDVELEVEAVPVEQTEILAFKIANEEYAVKIIELQEVLREQSVTPVPRSPKYLKGVTSLRGKILPIIDLREKLGLKDKNIGKEKIIVLAGKKEPLGALVGGLLGVFRFPASELLPPPSTLTDEGKGFIGGVIKINGKFISILNVEEILRMEEI